MGRGRVDDREYRYVVEASAVNATQTDSWWITTVNIMPRNKTINSQVLKSSLNIFNKSRPPAVGYCGLKLNAPLGFGTTGVVPVVRNTIFIITNRRRANTTTPWDFCFVKSVGTHHLVTVINGYNIISFVLAKIKLFSSAHQTAAKATRQPL